MLAKNVNDRPSPSKDGTSDRNPSQTLITPLPTNGNFVGVNQTAVTVDDHYAAFVKQQGRSSRHLKDGFWSSLSHEFDSLRQLIEGQTEDEDNFDDPGSLSIEDQEPSSIFIFQDPGGLVESETIYPSDAHSAVLFRYYFANFDPICKILHRPTVSAYFSNVKALVDPLTGKFKFRSLEAVTFAAYFAAANSMPPEQCLMHIGEQKDALVARLRHCVEVALVRADFLNSLEITTLQAFIIYIVSASSLAMYMLARSSFDRDVCSGVFRGSPVGQ